MIRATDTTQNGGLNREYIGSVLAWPKPLWSGYATDPARAAMRLEHDGLAVLYRTLAPSPIWAVERELMSIGLADLKYASDASRSVLRRARERAAATAPPVERPTTREIHEVLNDGDRERRIQLLSRVLIAEHCHTEGDDRLTTEGDGLPCPPSGPVGDVPP